MLVLRTNLLKIEEKSKDKGIEIYGKGLDLESNIFVVLTIAHPNKGSSTTVLTYILYWTREDESSF
jgi:hypothetical protein